MKNSLKYKTILLFSFIILASTSIFIPANAEDTPNKNVKIYTDDDLFEFVHHAPKGSKGTLMNDIHIQSNYDFDTDNYTTLYDIEFDGNHHTISSSGFESQDNNRKRLFYSLSHSIIKNVTLDLGSVNSTSDFMYLVSSITDDSLMENCTLKGTVNLDLTANDYLSSGLVYSVEDSTVRNCTNYSNVDYNLNGTTIPYTETHACGIAIKGKNSTFEKCVNYGNISGGAYTAGITSVTINNIFQDCENYGELCGALYVGGISGGHEEGQYINCNNYGSIIGICSTGGICGYIDQGIISQCNNEGTINGKFHLGGITGNFYNATIEKCNNYGSITSVENYTYSIGGIIGHMSITRSGGENIVDSCINYAIIDAKNTEEVGGIIGLSLGSDTTIKNCINNAPSITASNITGGIAGSIDDCVLQDCINCTPIDNIISTNENKTPKIGAIYGNFEGSDENITGCQEMHTHVYDATPTTVIEATTQATGVELYKCQHCDSYKRVILPVLQQTPDSNSTTPGSTPDNSVPESNSGNVPSKPNSSPENPVDSNTSNNNPNHSEESKQDPTKQDDAKHNDTTLKVSKPKISYAKNNKKATITIKIKKTKNAKKYQYQWATNSKFKKAKSKTTKKTTYLIKKLKKGKTYYIRVRGINKKSKSKWSKVKKVQIRK